VALRAERPGWQDLTVADFAEVIRSSAKKRYEMADGRIRALYGHSVPGKLSRTAAQPPDRLFHGTSPGALDAIRRAGLQPMARQYVHLSPERTDAVAVGRRKHPQPVILLIDAVAAAEAGIRFYAGNDKVWLADEVPWRFITLES
jgi:putative RNA 2'-phosphotransferase